MNNIEKNKFGTFGGVFVPNFLTIIGIILFLRLGWVVGNAGLFKALLIIIIANSITLFTGLSLSEVSTNIKVKTGGPYFIISRSFGLEIGGSIGITLYLSQSISVALYLLGFAEALSNIIPGLNIKLTALITLIIFAGIAWKGAGAAIKIQYIILIIIVLSLISFFMGKTAFSQNPQLFFGSHYSENNSFWSVFSIFFPAVTGIMAGASMSGDLKDSTRSIPIGTLSAVIITFFIYTASAVWLANNAEPSELVNNKFIMYKIASVPSLIAAGVIVATLSSALASIVAAPRILQALSNDKIIPRFFSLTLNSPTEPRMGVIFTSIIAFIFIYAGNLDVVATIITMFFLNTYGMTNLTAVFEKLISNPSYRPTFKVHWIISLLGAAGCYFVMFLINAQATVSAVVVSYGIYTILAKRSISKTWGDLREGIWFSLAKFFIFQLNNYESHIKNWKPNILVFTGNPKNRIHLVKLARYLRKGEGILTFINVLPKNKKNFETSALNSLNKVIENEKIKVFSEVLFSDDFYNDIINFSQAYGVGKLHPNTVMLGLSDDIENQKKIFSIVPEFESINKNVILLYVKDDAEQFNYDNTRESIIDVWWRGLKGNSGLMLLLAYLLQLNRTRKNSTIRLLSIIDNEDGQIYMEENIQNILKKLRLKKIEIKILIKDDSFENIIIKESRNSEFIILGMPDLSKIEIDSYMSTVKNFTENFSKIIFVRSSQSEEQYIVY